MIQIDLFYAMYFKTGKAPAYKTVLISSSNRTDALNKMVDIIQKDLLMRNVIINSFKMLISEVDDA